MGSRPWLQGRHSQESAPHPKTKSCATGHVIGTLRRGFYCRCRQSEQGLYRVVGETLKHSPSQTTVTTVIMIFHYWQRLAHTRNLHNSNWYSTPTTPAQTTRNPCPGRPECCTVSSFIGDDLLYQIIHSVRPRSGIGRGTLWFGRPGWGGGWGGHSSARSCLSPGGWSFTGLTVWIRDATFHHRFTGTSVTFSLPAIVASN